MCAVVPRLLWVRYPPKFCNATKRRGVPSADNAVECEDEAGQKPQQPEVTFRVHVRKAGTPKSIRKSDRNRLDAARLVCMTEVRDLPDPVAGCRRLAGIWDVAAQRFWYGPREKATAR